MKQMTAKVSSDTEDDLSGSLFGDYHSSSKNEDLFHQAEVSDNKFLPLYPGSNITVCGA